MCHAGVSQAEGGVFALVGSPLLRDLSLAAGHRRLPCGGRCSVSPRFVLCQEIVTHLGIAAEDEIGAEVIEKDDGEGGDLIRAIVAEILGFAQR